MKELSAPPIPPDAIHIHICEAAGWTRIDNKNKTGYPEEARHWEDLPALTLDLVQQALGRKGKKFQTAFWYELYMRPEVSTEADILLLPATTWAAVFIETENALK